MRDIPKRFPEYSIMHKTILNQIKKLEKEDGTLEVKNKIKIYTLELKKIEDMFPENFFEKKN
jgi:hypothetical protein